MQSIHLLVENVSNQIHADINLLSQYPIDNDIIANECENNIHDLRDCLTVLDEADKTSLDDLAADVFTSWLDTIVRENLLVQIDRMARNMPSIGKGILA